MKVAEDQFDRIDVLVDNAGYGYRSTVEEADDKEIRAQFEVEARRKVGLATDFAEK